MAATLDGGPVGVNRGVTPSGAPPTDCGILRPGPIIGGVPTRASSGRDDQTLGKRGRFDGSSVVPGPPLALHRPAPRRPRGGRGRTSNRADGVLLRRGGRRRVEDD